MSFAHSICPALIAVVLAVSAVQAAEKIPFPFVSPMFGDNMVLHRGKPVRTDDWPGAMDNAKPW